MADDSRMEWAFQGVVMLWDTPFIDRRERYARKSVAVRRFTPDLGDVTVDASGIDLEPGELPLLMAHDANRCVGWVTRLWSDKDRLLFEARALPELMEPDATLLSLTRGCGVSPSLHQLDYAPRLNSEGPPDLCTKAVITEVSLCWLPACCGARATIVHEAGGQ